MKKRQKKKNARHKCPACGFGCVVRNYHRIATGRFVATFEWCYKCFNNVGEN